MSQNKAITLVDLLVGIVIFSLVVSAVSVINLFSQRELQISSRTAQCQKEVSYVVEYIIKEVFKGIGDFSYPAVAGTTIDSNPGIIIRKDSNRNGELDMQTDQQSAFVYNAETHEMLYYSDVSNPNRQVISKKIFMPNFVPEIRKNYVTIEVTACWDPGKTRVRADCGSQDNPLVTMKSSIAMPSVSTH